MPVEVPQVGTCRRSSNVLTAFDSNEGVAEVPQPGKIQRRNGD